MTLGGGTAALDETRVLITGGRGFVGRRLAARIAAEEPSWRLTVASGPFDAGGVDGRIDITDPDAVEAWVVEHRPSVVVHLAAVAAVTAASRDPRLAWDVNLGGTLNLVLALQRHAPNAHLLFVSSSEVYGASLGVGGAADESVLLQPVNPYAASKAAADLLVRQAAAEGLSAAVMRPFNHTGAGQSEAFVAPNFAAQIARIEAGLQPPVLHVGALDEARDFLDVEDVVAAYLAVLRRRCEAPPGTVFNVASGRAVPIGRLLEVLLSLASVKVEVRVNSDRLRHTAPRRVVGDASRLRALTAWSPTIPLEKTLSMLLDHHRARVVIEKVTVRSSSS